jgi:tetratricopeptide (TPR) repeat protein
MSDSPRIEELQRRVDRDPASISFAGLAEEYRRLGRYEEAIETCRAGLQRHPSYVSAHVTLGRALMGIGQLEAATVELEQVLRVAPENLAAIRALAEIHRRRGEIPEVMESYRSGPEPAVPAAEPISPSAPIAVQSSAVRLDAEPALAGLESFLAAIQRARRDVMFLAAR